MPDTSAKKIARLGLSLSGGGYRAAAFHLGTLHKLDEMGILPRIDVLSTISGGSITGAAYCLHRGDYASFQARMSQALRECSVIGRALRSGASLRFGLFLLVFLGAAGWLLFTPWAPWAVVVLAVLVWLLLKYQFQLFPVSQEIEKAYDAFFFQQRPLQDLAGQPGRPLLAIGSSNLQTGRPFTFSRDWMGDSAYSYAQPPIQFVATGFPIARAVMASSCVPFAFTPVAIARPFFQNPADYDRVSPRLIDGGVYDNQGIQKLTQPGSYYECDIIITSDAGRGLVFKESYRNTVALLLRTVDLFMNRIKNFQMAANLFQRVVGQGKPVAYLSLGWRLADCIPGFADNMAQGNVLPSVLAARQLPQAWIAAPKQYRADIIAFLEAQVNYPALKARDLSEEEWNMARNIGTNLTPLTARELDALVRQAQNLTELQVRLYLPWSFPH